MRGGRGSSRRPRGPRLVLLAAALTGSTTLCGCSFGASLEEALSPGAEDTEVVTTSRQNPEIPEGQMLFFATWYEDPAIVAGDINADVMDALRAADGEVTCSEVPPRPFSGSDAPGQDCEFTWSDGREGSYVIEGGGLPNDDADTDVDGSAINLSAEYPETQ